MFKIEIDKQHEDPMVRKDLETNLENIQVTDQMIKQEMEEVLDTNQPNIVNIVIKMVILGNNVR